MVWWRLRIRNPRGERREARGDEVRTNLCVRRGVEPPRRCLGREEGGPDRLSQRIDEDGSAGDWEVLGFVEELEMYSILLSSLFTTHPAAPVIRSFSSFPQGGPSTPKQNTKKERKKKTHKGTHTQSRDNTGQRLYLVIYAHCSGSYTSHCGPSVQAQDPNLMIGLTSTNKLNLFRLMVLPCMIIYRARPPLTGCQRRTRP